MLTMCREFGFEITLDAADAGVATARLEIALRLTALLQASGSGRLGVERVASAAQAPPR